LGLLSLLDKKEEQKMSDDEKMLKNVHKSVERAIGIINEMLSTAEYGVRRFTATKTTYDANELVSAVVGELTSMARQKNVILHFKSAPVCSPAEGDTRLIKAMLHNVLDNAVRYSPNGEVNVSVSCEGELLHIEVSDTGIGIAKDDIPYIFERFYRGKNALALDPNESGLGLYIAKKVVDIHNGDIIVSSEAGKGTIVKIRLPLQKTKV
jgi:two-component system phosphate regulon sensor histidine kinase PhoR